MTGGADELLGTAAVVAGGSGVGRGSDGVLSGRGQHWGGILDQ